MHCSHLDHLTVPAQPSLSTPMNMKTGRCKYAMLTINIFWRLKSHSVLCMYVCMYMCVVKLCIMFRDSDSGEDRYHEIPTTEGGSARYDTIPSAADKECKASAPATVGKGPGPSSSNAPSVLDEPRRHVFHRIRY